MEVGFVDENETHSPSVLTQSVVKEVNFNSVGSLKLACDWSSGIGGDLWTTGLQLCGHFAINHDFYLNSFKNKRVLELGAGTGLVGLYIASFLAASEVFISDLPSQLNIINRNVFLNENNMKANVKVVAYDWEIFPVDLNYSFDLIVATDVVYSPELYSPFVEALKNTASKHSVIILGVTKTDTRMDFFRLLKKAGFIYYKIPDNQCDTIFQGTFFGLFVVHKKTHTP